MECPKSEAGDTALCSKVKKGEGRTFCEHLLSLSNLLKVPQLVCHCNPTLILHTSSILNRFCSVVLAVPPSIVTRRSNDMPYLQEVVPIQRPWWIRTRNLYIQSPDRTNRTLMFNPPYFPSYWGPFSILSSKRSHKLSSVC
jgi:hypothetical protein